MAKRRGGFESQHLGSVSNLPTSHGCMLTIIEGEMYVCSTGVCSLECFLLHTGFADMI